MKVISLPINKDISGFEKAIDEKHIGKIIGYIDVWFDKYSDANIEAYKDGLKTEDEKKEYEQKIVRYESLVSKGKQILISYVEENQNNLFNLAVNDKKLFLRAVETLIYHKYFDINSVDERELINQVLVFLSSASKPDKDIFERISRLLNTDIESSDKDEDGNPIKIIWAASVLGDMKLLSRLVRESYGKNYKALRNIYLRINNLPLPSSDEDDPDYKLGCSIMDDKKCDMFIPAGNFYFIAFPFSEQGIEDKIIEALKEKFKDSLKPLIARGVLENKTALCQICGFILSSRFGVYVLNKYSLDGLNRHLPNPNVTLELGLALGHKKRYIMLIEKGTTIISDLGGYLRIEYNDINDIPARIKEYSFANFYNEDTE